MTSISNLLPDIFIFESSLLRIESGIFFVTRYVHRSKSSLSLTCMVELHCDLHRLPWFSNKSGEQLDWGCEVPRSGCLALLK